MSTIHGQDVMQALLAPVLAGNATQKTLLINPIYCDDLKAFQHAACVQYFYPYAEGLRQHGFDLSQSLEDMNEPFEQILINIPKNKTEALYWIAKACHLLGDGGMISCAAANKAGGSRLQKMLQQFGFMDVESASMNKCRTAYALKPQAFDQAYLDACLAAGAAQLVLGGAYASQAGIYGWDKIDVGSQILMQHVPEKLSARRVADFGCGYGYLTQALANRLSPPYKLYAIDADVRAVQMTQENAASVEPVWTDIVAGHDLPQNLDLIVMNPPFHEGKKADNAIGQAFIARAANCLRTKGVLYMVANTHLPYEKTLTQHFSQHEKLYEGQGFKVYKAVK